MTRQRAPPPPARDRRGADRHGVRRGLHRPGDRACWRACSTQPVRGPGGLRRHPGRLRHRPAAHPAGHVAAAAAAAAPPGRRARLAGRRLPARRRPPPGAALHRAHRRQRHRHHCWPATAACTGWSRRRSAARCATRRCSRSSPPGRPRRTAQVACVDCHIGEGARAFVHAKLAGVRQLGHVDHRRHSEAHPAAAPRCRRAPRPQTCRAATSRARSSAIASASIREYADDEANTETKTVLQMHVGRDCRHRAAPSTGTPIPSTRIEYVATDDGAADDPLRPA